MVKTNTVTTTTTPMYWEPEKGNKFTRMIKSWEFVYISLMWTVIVSLLWGLWDYDHQYLKRDLDACQMAHNQLISDYNMSHITLKLDETLLDQFKTNDFMQIKLIKLGGK